MAMGFCSKGERERSGLIPKLKEKCGFIAKEQSEGLWSMEITKRVG